MNAEAKRRAAKHLGHTWFFGERFRKYNCVLFGTLSEGIDSIEFQNRRTASFIKSGKEWERNTRSRSEMLFWTLNHKFSHLQVEADSFQELWSRPTMTADFGSSFWQVPYTSHVCLLGDKIHDRGMYLFTISYGSYAMDQGSGVGWFSGWVDDLRHLLVAFSMPNFGVLDARIASALNKIIHNSHFRRRIRLEEQNAQKKKKNISFFAQHRLLSWSMSTSLSHEPTISVESFDDVFTLVLGNDDIQEFDSKWDGILLSMTKIPLDHTFEGLYKVRIRESEKLKTVLELCDLETHHKMIGPDNQSLKTLVKRTSSKTYETRILAPEMEIMKERQWSRIRR